MKKENLEQWEQDNINRFKKNVKESEGCCVVCHIIPSKSGLSRKVKFLYWDSETKSFCNLWNVLKNLGYKTDKNDFLTIKGCGMNMIWHTLNNIYSELKIERAEYLAEHYQTI